MNNPDSVKINHHQCYKVGGGEAHRFWKIKAGWGGKVNIYTTEAVNWHLDI